MNTTLSISGAVTKIDQFGQKKPVAGNYKIEISAKAGQAEVQKSNIFEREISEEYLAEETDINGETVHVMRTRQRAATLKDMTAFKDNSGAFILNEPQKIQIIQGDGKTAEVILYSEDTLDDVSRKTFCGI